MQTCTDLEHWTNISISVVVLAVAALPGCSSRSERQPAQAVQEQPETDVGTAEAPPSSDELPTGRLAPATDIPEHEAAQQASGESRAALQDSPERPQMVDETVLVRLEPVQGVMSRIVNYYRPMRIPLSGEPQETLVAEPEYRSASPLYGAMRLGDGDDDIVTLVVDEVDQETPRIYIDRNNDEDLTNDGSGGWDRASGSTLGLSGVVIDAAYPRGPTPYTFEFNRFTTRLQDFVLYYRNTGREGEVISGDQGYNVAVLDENADGRFDDLENGTLIIDLNQDGKLVGNSDSAEHHKLNEPFNIHGKVWEIASLSSDGTELRLRPSQASVEMRRYLDPGYPAPTFAAKDLDDKPIDLAQKAEDVQYVLLDFWASWCGPCRAEYPYLRRLHARYRKHGLLILGVNLDSDRDRAVQAAEDNLLSYPHVFDGQGWQNAVAVLYRVHGIPQTYLLDRDLNIVAKDLRGSRLESRLADLLGHGDTEAAAKVEEAVREREPAASPAGRAPASSDVGRQIVLSTSQTEDARSQFDSVTFSQVQGAGFSAARVNGSNTEDNQLLPGTVLAAKTSQGRYAKLMIEEYGYNLVISWVTYDESGQAHSQGGDLKIRGTWSCDFDSGQEAKEDDDFCWEQVDKTERYLVPRNNAQFAVLGRRLGENVRCLADSKAEFSGVQGKNNWYYGYCEPKDGARYECESSKQFETFSDNKWVADSDAYWTHISADGASPNGKVTSGGKQPVEHWAIRRWSSNVEGPITVAGLFWVENGHPAADGVTGHVFVDGEQKWSEHLDSLDQTGRSYVIEASVGVGSVVDFVVSPGKTDWADSTTFTAKIYAPQ